jgi:hypothetical protein
VLCFFNGARPFKAAAPRKALQPNVRPAGRGHRPGNALRAALEENDIRTALLLVASLLGSLLFGAVVAYVAVETLPCHWFGTGFEGACADGALWASVGIGLAAAVLSFVYFCYRLLRGRAASPPVNFGTP